MGIEMRKLGTTDIYVSSLCYGCASAFGRDLISDDFAIELFKDAYDNGIRFFDTGHSYGMAEERIGKALSQNPGIKRNDIVISTKFGTRIVNGKHAHDVDPKWIRESVGLSLRRMNIDYIDLLYLHGPKEEDLPNTEMFDCLAQLKKEGLIRAIVASTFNLERMKKIAEERLFDVVMLDYNVVRRDREDIIKSLYDNGIGVVAGQAMGESLFLNSLYKIKSKKDLWYLARTLGRKGSRELYFLSRKYRFLNTLNGYDGSQIALKYVIDNPYISSASVGTCNLDHLHKNIQSLNIDIPDDIMNKIKNVKSKALDISK